MNDQRNTDRSDIGKALAAILNDRRDPSQSMGGVTIATDGRITTLDMETTGLSGHEPWPDHCIQEPTALGFAETPVGASRLKPIRIVADDARWTEIAMAVAEEGIPLDRQIMTVPDDRVLVLFDVSNPRDMDKLGRFMKAMKEADLLRPDVILLLDGFDHMGDTERENATLSAIAAVDLGYDPVEALGAAALFGHPVDVLAITGQVMNHLSSRDHSERARETELDVLGRMLELDMERRSKRSTYRCIRHEPRMHLAATALLPEKSGFDHRLANAAPRSARPQRGRRR